MTSKFVSEFVNNTLKLSKLHQMLFDYGQGNLEKIT